MVFLNSKIFLLCALFSLLMFSVIIGDNVSETLLLTFYSTEQLSFMFMINASGLFFISLLVMGAVDKVSRFKMASWVLLSECTILLTVRILISLNIHFIYLVLFSFAYIGKILLFLTFWTIANDLSDSREAKTLFPIIAAGGVAGGTSACFLTAYFVNIIGPQNLIFVWVLLLLCAYGIMNRLRIIFKRELSFVSRAHLGRVPFFRRLRSDMSLVSKEPLLRSMSILYFMMFFLLISLDFHFFNSLKAGLTELLTLKNAEMGAVILPGSSEFRLSLSKEMSRFLGIFRGIANVVTFLIQISVAGMVLKTLGTARSMFIMPFMFTMIFFFAFLQAKFQIFPQHISGMPLLFSNSMFIIILMGTASRIAFFDSLFSPNFQIFFSSLPSSIRGRGKMFIEGMAKPVAIMLAGASVLWISHTVLKHSPEKIWMHYFILFAVGLSLCVIVVWLQRGYTDSISQSLGGNKARQIASVLKMDRWRHSDKIVDLLIIQLFDPDPDIRRFSMEILCQLENEHADRAIDKVLKMNAYRERAELICILGRNYRLNNRMQDVENWLQDNDPRIIASAVDASRYLPYSHVENMIQTYVRHPFAPIATRAISVSWPHANDIFKLEILSKIRQLCGSRNADDIRLTMDTIAEIGDPALLTCLEEARLELKKLIGEYSANRLAIECLAGIPDETAAERVLNSLNQYSEAFRKRIFVRLSGQMDVIQKVLDRWLNRFNEAQRYFLLELLFKNRYKGTKPLRKLFLIKLHECLQTAAFLKEQMRSLSECRQAEATLLMHAVSEGPLERTLEQITFLLALIQPSGNLFFTTPWLMSREKYHKSSALEAVETEFPRDISEKVIQVFLNKPVEKALKRSRKSGADKTDEMSAILDYWRFNTIYKWPRTCALYYVISKKPESVPETDVEQLRELLYGTVS